MTRVRRWMQVLLLLGLVHACASEDGVESASTGEGTDGGVLVEPLFPDAGVASAFEACVFSSPFAWEDGEEIWIVAVSGDGLVAGHHPTSGDVAWSFRLPAPEGEAVFALAQPVQLDQDRFVVAWHTVPGDHEAPWDANVERLSHRAGVMNLRSRGMDDAFEEVVLAAEVPSNEGGSVQFRPDRALMRGDLVIAGSTGAHLGRLYITMGNTRDIQPWHGWMFELDLDAWREGGAGEAIAAVFLTTPEEDENCGTEGRSGSFDRECGGGLWAPSGPLIEEHGDGSWSIVVGAGNGQLDLARQDYANTLMRLPPGLAFEPGCDAALCADFDPDAPAESCVSSCENLFIPRLMPGQEMQRPADGRCDGDMTLFECWQLLDYIGGSTPVRVEADGRPLLVYPTKDGHAYLVDGEQMGRLHARHRLVELCGTADDPCRMDWAGMVVTQPLVVDDGAEQLVLIPTFMPDRTHPAGVVALRVVTTDDGPAFERSWEWPRFDTPDAIAAFRVHSSRMVLASHGPGGRDIAWIVEVGQPGRQGTLVGLDPRTGELVAGVELAGRGQRFTVPLVVDDAVYVSSCPGDRQPGWVEGFRLRRDAR